LINDYLNKLGFSEKEIVIYLAATSLGTSTAGSLAKRTGVSRSTVYMALDRLVNKGLVVADYQETTTYFIVENPQKITELFVKEEQELAGKKKLAEKVVREMTPIYQRRGKAVPKIKFYYGKKDLLKMMEENLDAWVKSTIEIDPERVWWAYREELFSEEWMPFLMKIVEPYRQKKNYSVRTLAKISHPDDKKYADFREVRYIPKEYQIAGGRLWIMGEYVAMFYEETEPALALVIHDRVLAQMQRSMLQFMWRRAERVKNK